VTKFLLGSTVDSRMVSSPGGGNKVWDSRRCRGTLAGSLCWYCRERIQSEYFI